MATNATLAQQIAALLGEELAAKKADALAAKIAKLVPAPAPAPKASEPKPLTAIDALAFIAGELGVGKSKPAGRSVHATKPSGAAKSAAKKAEKPKLATKKPATKKASAPKKAEKPKGKRKISQGTRAHMSKTKHGYWALFRAERGDPAKKGDVEAIKALDAATAREYRANIKKRLEQAGKKPAAAPKAAPKASTRAKLEEVATAPAENGVTKAALTPRMRDVLGL